MFHDKRPSDVYTAPQAGFTSAELREVDEGDMLGYVSLKFAPKLAGEPEVIYETGGSQTGTGLVYEAPNTLTVLKCLNGRSLSVKLLDSQVGDDAPYLDIYWGYILGSSVQLMLVIDGAVVVSTVDDTNADLAGSDNGGAFRLSGTICKYGREAASLTSAEPDLDVGLQIFFETDPLIAADIDVDSLAMQLCSGHGVAARRSNGRAECACQSGYTGHWCEKEDAASKAVSSCWDMNYYAPSGPVTLRLSEDTSAEVLCNHDITGGGYTLCGKYNRDNGPGRTTVDFDFGRSDETAGDLKDVGSFTKYPWQASMVRVNRGGGESSFFGHTVVHVPVIIQANLRVLQFVCKGLPAAVAWQGAGRLPAHSHGRRQCRDDGLQQNHDYPAGDV